MGMTLTDFEQRTTTKKGNVGEQIIKNFLENKQFIVYAPASQGAHLADGFAARTHDEIIIAFDVKTKARMNKFHATGIDVRHFNRYRNIEEKHKIHFFLFFVDELLQKVYGNWLFELLKIRTDSEDGLQYPRILHAGNGAEIKLFSLDAMKDIADLNGEQAQQLRMLSTRSYGYEVKNVIA